MFETFWGVAGGLQNESEGEYETTKETGEKHMENNTPEAMRPQQ